MEWKNLFAIPGQGEDLALSSSPSSVKLDSISP